MQLELIDPKKHRQLFLDDFAVERVQGVTRTLHSPKKWGHVIHGGGIQSRSCPQWNSEKNLWEWWYFGGHSYYAVSEDGERWEKPALGLYEFDGSTDNNIAFDPENMGQGLPFHVVRDETDSDSRRRYKALFNANSRRLAVSPDGFDWTLHDAPPIPSQDESQFIMISSRTGFWRWSSSVRNGDVPFGSPRVRIFVPSPNHN